MFGLFICFSLKRVYAGHTGYQKNSGVPRKNYHLSGDDGFSRSNVHNQRNFRMMGWVLLFRRGSVLILVGFIKVVTWLKGDGGCDDEGGWALNGLCDREGL